MMRNLKLYIFFSLFFTKLSAQDALKSEISNKLTNQNLAGAVWTVVENGEIKTNSAGYANLATKELMKPESKVHIGSITKPILAVGVLHLATEGKINLDESVSKYLQKMQLINKWNATNPVTVRHLLDHTSGLSDSKLWHIFSTSSTPNTALSSFYKNDPKVLTIQAKPGSIYSYSNMGYTLLGIIIETVTKERYEQYLDQNVLKRIGMSNSTFQFVSQEGKNADKMLAMGHFDNGKTTTAQPIYLRPAGQITTTAYDMGLFLNFVMSNGTIGGQKFVDEKYLQNIGIQNYTEASQKGVPFGYALGAYKRDRHGVVGTSVIGNILGFAARLYWFPEQKKAFFISHNMDSETANYEVFNAILIKHLKLGNQTRKLKVTNTNHEISQYGGYYVPMITKVEPFGILDKIFSFTKVEVLNEGAMLNPTQKKSQKLVYVGKNLFSSDGRAAISHSFYKNENNDLIISDGISTIKKASGFKILLIAMSFILGFSGIVYLLFSIIYQAFKFKGKFLNQAIFLCSIAIFTILFALFLIFSQPFISLGDKTTGNILLYIGTFLLPILSSFSFIKYIKNDNTKWLYKFDFLCLFFVLQFSLLLFLNDMLPLCLWK